MTPKIENARIKSTMLGTEDHGCLTCFLALEFANGACGFGGYAFDGYDADEKERRGQTGFGAEYIRRLLDVLEVSTWEKLPGTLVRVENTGWGGGVTRVGHYMKDRWFDPKELAAEFAEAVK